MAFLLSEGFLFGPEKGAARIGISRTGEFEICVADIEHPRSASLTVYRDSFGWLTIADSDGGETTIFVNLDDEGDRKFVVQLRQAADVLAIMSADEGEDDGGDEEA